jgi:regulator of sigma E protease
MILTLIAFLVLISVLVLVHEFGHFFAAKRLGIRVEEFGFGFPPRVFGKRIGETLYSLNIFPFGGFVKLYGEDEAGGGRIDLVGKRRPVADLKRAFFAKSPWQRAFVILSGVLMNFFLAVFIFYIFLAMSGFKTSLPLFDNFHFFGAIQSRQVEIIVTSVAANSPAQKAGIKPPAKIVSVNKQKIDRTETFTDIINQNKGKEVLVEWQDLSTNKIYTARIIPRVSPPKGQGALGVTFFGATTITLHYATPVQRIFSGFVHPINILAYNVDVLAKLVAVSVKQKTIKPVGESVAGPVGIYSLIGNIGEISNLKERILQYLNLAAVLSLSLAFFNILPIPALDGGRLFFVLVEGVTGKKVPEKAERFVHAIGFAILITLLLLITFQDIARLVRR